MENSKKAEKMSENSVEESGIWKDPRFSHLVNDPRFKNISESRRKVKIDRRFQSMFKDPKFSLKYTVDKYGRHVEKGQSDELKKYYALSDDEEEVQEEEKAESAADSDENDDLEVDGKIDKKMKKRLKDLEIDYARGEAKILTDSSSDDESSEDEEEEVVFDHVWGELDNDAPRTDESTKRIAACNMDWDKMRSVDIMVLCNSFLPEGGKIEKVSIYPSEFGKERMKEEDLKGPAELLAAGMEAEEDGTIVKDSKDRDLEGDSYHMEKLRQYQLNRLKYFYAVIECDSVRTADALYAECDGLEYESSATKMDLRFIPDDMEFDDEAHDICTKLPNLQEYKSRIFETTALQNAKVNLTWDDTCEDRKEFNEKIAQGRLKEVSQEDLKRFITYSSEEEDEEDTKTPSRKIETHKSLEDSDQDSESEDSEGDKKSSIAKYKLLLNEINEQEKLKKNDKIERELSWGVMVEKNDAEQEGDSSANDENPSLTPFERLVEKKKQKQKKRRADIRKKLNGGESDGESSDDIPDGIDMNDPYFAEEFADGNFAPPKNAKKAQKQRKEREAEEKAAQEEEEKQSAELALLLDDEQDGKSHFSLKKIQTSEMETKKRKRKKQLKKSKAQIAEVKAKKANEDNFQINVNDERFSAVFSSHLFSIDPTDPSFKKTKAMDTLIEEKLKRKQEGRPEKFLDGEQSSKRIKKDAEVSVLVKSIKRKVKSN